MTGPARASYSSLSWAVRAFSDGRFERTPTVICKLSLRVVKNDPEGMPPARTQSTHPVPHVDPIHAPRALNRSMMDREDHTLTLAQRDDLDARLHAWALLGEDEFTAREIDSRPGEQKRNLEREDVFAVEVLVQAVVIVRVRIGAVAALAWAGPRCGNGRERLCALAGSGHRYPLPRSSGWRSLQAACRERSSMS